MDTKKIEEALKSRFISGYPNARFEVMFDEQNNLLMRDRRESSPLSGVGWKAAFVLDELQRKPSGGTLKTRRESRGMTKAERIRNTIRETKERRKDLRPVVFRLKLQNLSRKKAEILERAFLEAKWLYNWLVSDLERLNIPANKVDTVEVKVGDVFEERQLVALGSQVKQEIADRLKDNLSALAKLRENGHKVGHLKPKKFVNSIPLKQYGVTYSLNFARNRVRIQKLGSFRILGLHQIPSDVEIASAVLVRKPSGYYLHVTCYLPWEYFRRPYKLGEAVGGDFGVETKITLSNGIRIDFEVHESPRLKWLQRKLAKAKGGSKNREKIRLLLRREYEKLNNKRRDAQNKILAFLRLYGKVVFQDDYVKSWAVLFGRQVHSSGIGGLKARLKNSLEAPVLVGRFEPTSQECYACGKRHKLSLSDRVIRCDCGWICDRDLNAALVILRKGLGLSPDQAVGLDRPELKPLEKEAAARILGSNPCIRVSFLL
jgi:putative transposase